jgi:hypothetical protein
LSELDMVGLIVSEARFHAILFKVSKC